MSLSLKSRSTFGFVVGALLWAGCTQPTDRVSEQPPPSRSAAADNAESQPAVLPANFPELSDEEKAVAWARYREAVSAEYVEARLEGWRPQDDDDVVPPDRCRVPSMEITGEWLCESRLIRASLTIHSREDGKYSVDFSTSGCLRRWRLHRVGTFDDGVLMLDKPVQEYSSVTFNKMYAIRLGHQEMLLPAPNVSRIMRSLTDENACDPQPWSVLVHTYGRPEARVRKGEFVEMIITSP